jgi:hypothetical protein
MLIKAAAILLGLAVTVMVAKMASLPTADVVAVAAFAISVYLWVNFLLLKVAVLNVFQFLIKKYGREKIREVLNDQTRNVGQD